MSDPSNDRRGPISAAALVALIGGMGVFYGANNQGTTTPVPVPTTTATAEVTAPSTSTAPSAVPTAADVSAGLDACKGMTAGSQEQIDCARTLVAGARSALVDGIASGADTSVLAGLWKDQATALALGLGAGDDPTAVFPEGALPSPSGGPSANTATCTPAAGTRRNLGVPGTNNRPSALAVSTCTADGAVALVALFRNSGGYYADGVASKVCTGTRCAVQAPSNNRCGKYRSYVVVYNLNAKNEAGPVSDKWSPENRYCNPKAS